MRGKVAWYGPLDCDIMDSMAGSALPVSSQEPLPEVRNILERPSVVRKKTILKAAKLYGRGHKRSDIAKALESGLLSPAERKKSPEERHRRAKRRLFGLEQNVTFRDLIFDAALEKLDGESPAILQGIAHKARSGRVDAAKFALELTGRYTPSPTAHRPLWSFPSSTFLAHTAKAWW